jgi:hypothetical protein
MSPLEMLHENVPHPELLVPPLLQLPLRILLSNKFTKRAGDPVPGLILLRDLHVLNEMVEKESLSRSSSLNEEESESSTMEVN